MKIGRITISDRASAGIYEDRGGPEVDQCLHELIDAQAILITRVIPDDLTLIEKTLRELTEQDDCHLIITTGGTGISPRDVTPEATRNIIEKELPGFGEWMRLRSMEQTPTAILSRATAGIYRKTLIINLPGKPQAIRFCLEAILPAIKDAIEHLHE